MNAEFQAKLWARCPRRHDEPHWHVLAALEAVGRMDAYAGAGDRDRELEATGEVAIALINYCSAREVVFWPLLRRSDREDRGVNKISALCNCLSLLSRIEVARHQNHPFMKDDLDMKPTIEAAVTAAAWALRAIARRRGEDLEMLVPLVASRGG